MWLLTSPKAAQQDAQEQAETLARFGVPKEQIEGPKEGDGAFCLWAWHLDVFRLFGAMRTQWNCAVGMTVVCIGLKYEAMPAVLPFLRLTDPTRPGLLEELQTMEVAGSNHKNGVSK